MGIVKCINNIRRKHAHILQCVMLVVAVIFLLHPDRNARGGYPHISREEILDNLVPAVSTNLTTSSSMDCDYKSIIFESKLMEEPVHAGPYSLVDSPPIQEGGEYSPKDCKPLFSSAVLVPYRDRATSLHAFLIHMHNFLRPQNIHYRIFVIEQLNMKAFNRAKLLNIGAVRAARAGFPCLVLHDVDLLPLHPAQLYACTDQPRHMSANINKFRYVLPYLTLFGGAVSMQTSQFESVNGMSNLYRGWGAEDDDLSGRLRARGLRVTRFDPLLSRYYMPLHAPESKGEKNVALLNSASERIDSDGLGSLRYTEVSTVLHPLFTHVMVDF